MQMRHREIGGAARRWPTFSAGYLARQRGHSQPSRKPFALFAASTDFPCRVNGTVTRKKVWPGVYTGPLLRAPAASLSGNSIWGNSLPAESRLTEAMMRMAVTKMVVVQLLRADGGWQIAPIFFEGRVRVEIRDSYRSTFLL